MREQNKHGVFATFWQYTHGLKRYFFLALLTTFGSILFSFLTPQIIRLTVDSVNRFLRTLPPDACSVFIMRYGKGCSVREIAQMFDFTQSKVLVTLLRTRNQLRAWLESEGFL